MHVVVMGCVCQSLINKYLFTYLRDVMYMTLDRRTADNIECRSAD